MQIFVILTLSLRPMPSAKFVLIIHHVSRCNRAAISAGWVIPKLYSGEWTNVFMALHPKKIIH